MISNSPRLWAVSAFLLGCFFAQPAFSQCMFSVSNLTPCPGETVTFTVNDPMTNSIYKWDLDGDGQFDDGTGATKTYAYPYLATAKNYTVRLEKDGAVCPESKIVMVKAGVQPTLGVASGGTLMGDIISACDGDTTVTLSVNNTSSTATNFTGYTINWGDGSPLGMYTNANFNSNTAVSHNYVGLGYKPINLSATHSNGCVLTKTYQFFNGSNPSIGMTNPGGTTGLCAPKTLSFPLSGFSGNPPGTKYIFELNGVQIAQYTDTPPNPFVYTFTESSCGKTPNTPGYQNAFELTVTASNPCSKSSATIVPITLSTAPVPDFMIVEPSKKCPGEVWSFMNTSTNIHEILSNGTCVDTLNATWSISPGQSPADWEVVGGGLINFNKARVKFKTPGDYTIKMTLNPQPKCGPATITKTITVLEPPKAIAETDLTPMNGCAPLTVDFTNKSTGYEVTYNWHIAPGSGWSWLPPNSGNGDISAKEPTAVFNTPGTYSVTLTATNVCATSTAVLSIVVKAKPTVVLPMLGPFCKEATLNFNAPTAPTYGNGGGTITEYKWSFPGGTPDNATGPNPTGIKYGPVTVATSFTYTVTVTNECGPTTASKTFEIQVPATISLPPDRTVCANAAPFQIMPVTPANGTWSGNPGVTASGFFTPANAGGAGEKTLTYTYGAAGSACTATKTMKITIVDLPAVSAGLDLKKCVSDPAFALGGSPAPPPGTGAWTSSPATPALSGGNFNPTAVTAPPSTFTLTYTYTDANGCLNSDQMALTINALPVITASNAAFCHLPGKVPMPPATPTGGTWSGPGVMGNEFDPIAAGLGPHTVTYAYTDQQTMCSNTKSITITVGPPESINAGPDKVFCKNDPPYNLNSDASNAVGGNWSGPGVSGNFFDPAMAGPGPGPYTIKLEKGAANCKVTDERVMTVNPIPTVDVPDVAKSCVSETAVTLPATTPVMGGTWTSVPPGLVTGNVFNAADAGVGNFTLTYTYTDPLTKCTNSDNLTMTVNALPVVTSSDATFCKTPGLVDLPPATPTGGTWSGTGVSGSKFNPETPGGPAFMLTYAYTNPATGCSNSTAVTITVVSPDNVNAGEDEVFCKNDPVFTLNGMPAPGDWVSVPPTPDLSGGTFDPKTPGKFTLTYSVGSGNCRVSDVREITVNDLPPVDVPATAKTCVDEIAVVLPPPTQPAAGGGEWTSNPPGLVTVNIFNAVNAGAGDFTLTYTYTDPLTKCTNRDNLTMTVHPLPEIKVGDTTYCNTPGATSLPYATPLGGTWTGPGISNGKFDPVAAGGVNNYTATYTFENTTTGCDNKKTVNIEVISPDNIDAGPDKVFCLNDAPFDLDSDASNSSGGNWSGPGVSGHSFDPAAAKAGTHTIVLKKGAGNCEVIDERIFKVNPLPDVVVPETAKTCINETAVVLSATTPAMGGIWTSVPAGLVAGTPGGTYTFNAKLAGQGDFTLTYTYTDGNKCTNSDDLKMTVHPLPVVAAPDATFCNTQGTVPLPAATPPGGMWSGTGISGNDFDPASAVTGVGVYPAIYTFTDGNQCTNRDTARIEVIAPVNIDAGRDTALCVSVTDFDLYTGGVFPAANGEWTPASLVSGNIFNAQAAGPGQHILTFFFGVDNCRVSDTRTITVNPLPVVMAGNDDDACISETAVTLAPSPANGTWTPGGAVLSGNTLNPNASGVGTFTLTYSFTDSFGCKNADSLLFTVHPLPKPMSKDTTFCNTPGLVKMPVAAPTTGGMGWWTGKGVSGFNFDPQGAGGVGVYPATYHFTDERGCTDSVTVSIKVIEPVQPVAGPNDTICIHDGLLQLAGFSPTTDGIWTGKGIVNAATGVFDPLVAGGGPHELDFSYGKGNCELHDKKTVLVIAVDIEAGDDRAVCFADSPFALPGFFPATGGTWTGAGITDAVTGKFSPAVAGVGDHVLRYEFVDPILGCTFRDSLKMRVNPMPESDFPQPANTCINDTVFFKNLSKSTFDVLWDFGDGGTSTSPEPTHIYTSTGTFTVKLTTKTEFGCTDMASRTIFVTEPPNARFALMPDTGCAVLKVKFDNQSTGFQPSYLWKFGNFKTDTLLDPGTVEFPGGTKDTTYIIVLEVKNLCATRTWTDSVLVHPLPIVIFGTTTDTICSGDLLVFTNISLGQGEDFEWDFGNGNTSTDSLPAPQQYFVEIDTLPKTYTIRLIASNFCGSDTAYHEVTVNPLDVSAFFNVPNYTGCQPYTVQFTNFATPGAKVFWNFGDGNTSSDFNPMHTFQTPGVFKVVQKASDGCGYDSAFAYITVLPAPVVSFECKPQICRNDTLQFSNTSPDPLSGVRWDFGDGDTSVLYNPTHAYDSAGLKTVTLVGISAKNGCPAPFSRVVKVLELPSVKFSTNKIDGCVPLKVAFQSQSQDSVYYEWDFGDGNTQSGPAPTHTYPAAGQYEVRLRAIDLNGCRNDTIFRYIIVHPIPSPDFDMVREHLCGVPVKVNFKNKTPDAVSFEWHFGDGPSTSPLNEPQHQYTQAGDFLVQLIAKNTYGCLDTAAQTFSAYAQPMADFAWSPEKGCAPLTVLFENLSTDATSAHWTFSDGGKSDSLERTTHTFYHSGKYGATLTVSHREVCFDTLELPKIVEVLPSPTANFTFAETLTMPTSGLFTFTDLSTEAARWLWTFGDGDSSTLQNPTHRYFSNGPKVVTLTVWGTNGCPDDTMRSVTPIPMHHLFIPNAFTPGLPNGEASQFLPKGVGLSEYHIAVYDAYGGLLWESEALTGGAPAEYWDGNFEGQPMGQDVYTWHLKKAIFDDGNVYGGPWVGSVTLIR